VRLISLSHGTKITERNIWGCGCLHKDIRKQFLEIARKNSPESEPRIVYSFMTTAIVRALPIFCLLHLLTLCVIVQDTRAMATTLAVIRTGILQDNLQNAGFIE
jgi:hypothetical protein